MPALPAAAAASPAAAAGAAAGSASAASVWSWDRRHTAEDIPDGATQFKCAPPIRTRDNREALWAGLLNGTIDLVVSDHSPCIPALKHLEAGDFMTAWGGIASLQLGLSSVWTEASRRGADVRTLSRWMTTGPARLLGLSSRGTIAPGMRADLLAWHPERSLTVTAAELLHRHALTPYLGQQQRGAVQHTWVGGQAVVRDGQLTHPAGDILLRKHP